MLTKRKHSLDSHFQASTNPSFDDSWEEQAFAEDAAGPLGGCIWPPRSYPCSFCRREFRSAQALGGHMNVHRRDRARLKQSPSPHNVILHHEHPKPRNHLQNPYTSFGFQYPSQLCTLDYCPNPNPDPGFIPSRTSSSRVSITSTQESFCDKTISPPFTSFIVEEQQKRSHKSSPPPQTKLAKERCHISSLSTEGEQNSRKIESGCRAKVDYVQTDLSVSLNLVVRRARPSISDCGEEPMSCRKRRIDKSSLPFFLKCNSADKHRVQSEVFEISPCTVDELDLELRLGDRPKLGKSIERPFDFKDISEETERAEKAAVYLFIIVLTTKGIFAWEEVPLTVTSSLHTGDIVFSDCSLYIQCFTQFSIIVESTKDSILMRFLVFKVDSHRR
ncbi:hypothetical protein NC652_036769 [Populus alba x Populus x berolinensis]|nr:hypothetical protein NC652_036769 [Populus alba x Populus x berolinensis]